MLSYCFLGTFLVYFPRTRGCSYLPFSDSKNFLNISRARGDVPIPFGSLIVEGIYFPRTRGCSYIGVNAGGLCQIFPAHAGMFLMSWFNRTLFSDISRARGDVPHHVFSFQYLHQYFPRTRGCSLKSTLTSESSTIFPAHAGMFLLLTQFI